MASGTIRNQVSSGPLRDLFDWITGKNQVESSPKIHASASIGGMKERSQSIDSFEIVSDRSSSLSGQKQKMSNQNDPHLVTYLQYVNKLKNI